MTIEQGPSIYICQICDKNKEIIATRLSETAPLKFSVYPVKFYNATMPSECVNGKLSSNDKSAGEEFL